MAGNKSGNSTTDRDKAPQTDRKGGQAGTDKTSTPKEREKATGNGGKGDKASPGGRN